MNNAKTGCVNACGLDEYPINNYCTKCSTAIATCVSCGSTTGLNINLCSTCSGSTSIVQQNLVPNTCVSTCGTSYYVSNNKCLPCIANCGTCTSAAPLNCSACINTSITI